MGLIQRIKTWIFKPIGTATLKEECHHSCRETPKVRRKRRYHPRKNEKNLPIKSQMYAMQVGDQITINDEAYYTTSPSEKRWKNFYMFSFYFGKAHNRKYKIKYQVREGNFRTYLITRTK